MLYKHDDLTPKAQNPIARHGYGDPCNSSAVKGTDKRVAGVCQPSFRLSERMSVGNRQIVIERDTSVRPHKQRYKLETRLKYSFTFLNKSRLISLTLI